MGPSSFWNWVSDWISLPQRDRTALWAYACQCSRHLQVLMCLCLPAANLLSLLEASAQELVALSCPISVVRSWIREHFWKVSIFHQAQILAGRLTSNFQAHDDRRILWSVGRSKHCRGYPRSACQHWSTGRELYPPSGLSVLFGRLAWVLHGHFSESIRVSSYLQLHLWVLLNHRRVILRQPPHLLSIDRLRHLQLIRDACALPEFWAIARRVPAQEFSCKSLSRQQLPMKL